MENAKLPLAIVIAMVAQISGGVWWVSQQASTIAGLEATVSEIANRGAIEDQVNLRRDVSRHTEEIDALWEAVDSNNMHMDSIVELKRRMSIIEIELKYLGQTPTHSMGR